MDYGFYNTQQSQPAAAFHQQQQMNHGYPTPVSQYALTIDAQQPQDVYQNNTTYQQFDQNYQFNSNGTYVSPTTQAPQQQPSPPMHLDVKDPISQMTSQHVNGNGLFSNGDYTADGQDQDGNRSSSEEGKESLTPAQSRRKAQNRAAQRAFRERKERHVKDLETKLHSLSAHSNTLLSDNERLKRELQRLATQNEILRATNSHHSAHLPSAGAANARSPSPIPGPQTFSPVDFQAAVGEGAHPVSYEDFGGPEGNRLLAVGAAWDYIMNHDDFRNGRVSMEAVHERLKGNTHCNGRGPAFKEEDIRRAIAESTISGGDAIML